MFIVCIIALGAIFGAGVQKHTDYQSCMKDASDKSFCEKFKTQK